MSIFANVFCEFLNHFATLEGGWNERERYCIYECGSRDNYVDDWVSRRQERHKFSHEIMSVLCAEGRRVMIEVCSAEGEDMSRDQARCGMVC